MTPRELISLADFKQHPRPGVLLHKQYTAKVSVMDEQRSTVEFSISTAAVDRMDDTIALDGWRLDNYRKNPIVLWGHDRTSPPIGRSLLEWIEGEALHSECEFTPADLNPFGDMIGKLVRAGYLNAVSVGFEPLRWKVNEEREGTGWLPPCDFLEQELLEYSVVTVPANPEALVGAKAAGIDLRPMIAHAEQVLSQTRGEGCWLERAQFEEAYRIATGDRKSFVIAITEGVKQGFSG